MGLISLVIHAKIIVVKIALGSENSSLIGEK